MLAALTQGAGGSATIAPYPWMKEQAWTQEKRDAQAARLEAALEHERRAIDEIAEALAVAGLAE